MRPRQSFRCALLASLSLSFLAGGSRALDSRAEDAYFIDASLDIDGKLLDWRFLDMDDDGRAELVIAVASEGGERELRVHRLRAQGLDPEPAEVVPMLADIVAWGAADVRSEAGLELLLLTRAGIWSYSLEHSGYRNNAVVLARTDLIYDVPDPRALGHWAYVLPAEGGDLVLVPELDGLALWGPSDANVPDPPYERLRAYSFAQGGVSEQAEEQAASAEAEVGGDGLSMELTDSPVFYGEDARGDAALFSGSFRYDAPALVDLDGDGRMDLVRVLDDALHVHMGQAKGPPAQPTRIERLPEELRGSDDVDVDDVELTLIDLDNDGDLDLLAQVSDEADGFENGLERLFLYRNDGASILREKPDQVLRFEAALLTVDVADVDGDGRVDLAMRKLVLPSLVGTVTGLEFEFSYMVFPGERRGFARRPTLRQVETYDEDSVVEIAANRELVLDCDGDGLADLVELDLKGRIAVRRLEKESSFLGGDEWSLEDAPWKLFDAGGQITSLTVEDFNGDGLGDIVSAGEDRLTLLLSAQRGSR